MQRTEKFPQVYVIIDHDVAASCSKGIESLTEEILDAGAGMVQYRAKRLSKGRYYQQVRALVEIAHDRNVPLLVNDHIDIALAISADGVHIGQNDLPLPAARKLLPDNMILGISTHSESQVADVIGINVGYIAIGPVFPTSTKNNPEPVIGVDTVGKVKKLIGSVPLVAIGGITVENAAEVIRSGADSIAIASAVIRAADPASVVRSLKETVERAGSKRS